MSMKLAKRAKFKCLWPMAALNPKGTGILRVFRVGRLHLRPVCRVTFVCMERGISGSSPKMEAITPVSQARLNRSSNATCNYPNITTGVSQERPARLKIGFITLRSSRPKRLDSMGSFRASHLPSEFVPLSQVR